MRVTLYSHTRLEELRNNPAHVELTLRRVREAIAQLEDTQRAEDADKARVLALWHSEHMERAQQAMDGVSRCQTN